MAQEKAKAANGKNSRKTAKGDSIRTEAFETFLKLLRKNQRESDAPRIAEVEQCFSIELSEGTPQKAWNITELPNTLSFQVLMESAAQANFTHLRALRLWKVQLGDEIARSLGLYFQTQPPLEELHITDSGMTAKGCALLSETLPSVRVLKLDYNKFGDSGLLALAKKLGQHSALKVLSLQYCEIGVDGGRYLAEMLLYVKSNLSTLLLKGNALRSDGAVQVLKACQFTTSLQQLDLSSNASNLCGELLECLVSLLHHKKSIESYDFSSNDITDANAEELLTAVTAHGSLKQLRLSERVQPSIIERIKGELKVCKSGKPKRGKR